MIQVARTVDDDGTLGQRVGCRIYDASTSTASLFFRPRCVGGRRPMENHASGDY